MHKLLYKAGISLATASLIAQGFAGVALASLDVEISGNGPNSDSTANVGVSNTTQVTQNNTANITNNVNVSADTGKNDANKNTGGDVDITTGNAKTTVGVSNTANANVADVNGCCVGDLNVTISGNGAKSTNEANVGVSASTLVFQNNSAKITNDVDVDADTGKNDANKNTGGDVEILTGNADADVDVSNLANFNFADVDSCGCILDGTVKIAGNGAKSDNDATVKLESKA